ncbi:retinaldehyde-binding protein 1-like [Chironomus tepperi]|uniref:retinaldehyde-binding protein 1-like n=1 Tax=Chironomus tepperi TaxID=113505 RepID=UPI00391FA1E0
MSETNAQLSEKFIQKALNELREDDSRKQQALEQFREWISKQGHIQYCRTDDSFLLRFLRVKKYTNAAAFKMLENFLIRSQQYPQWFRNLTLNDNKMRELFENAYIFPLKERDENGCRVIMVRGSQIDTKKYTFDDVVRMLNFVILTLLEEEETQIAGFSYIFDHKDIHSDYISLFPLFDVKNYLNCVQNALPGRQKRGILINLPSFIAKLLEFVKGLLSKKLRDRGYFYSDDIQLENHIDKKILPSEYGGQVPIKEMMEEFKKIAENYQSRLQATDAINIDMEYVKKHNDNEIESFRTLEID